MTRDLLRFAMFLFFLHWKEKRSLLLYSICLFLTAIRSTIRVRNRRSLIGKPSPTKTIRKTRVPFTAKEVEYLEEGIEKFGVGNWKEIIKHYKFNPRRTNQDLKDKWRNLMKYSKV